LAPNSLLSSKSARNKRAAQRLADEPDITFERIDAEI
jgi:hypothetical protein